MAGNLNGSIAAGYCWCSPNFQWAESGCEGVQSGRPAIGFACSRSARIATLGFTSLEEDLMVNTLSTMRPLRTEAPQFRLPDTEGKMVALEDFNGSPALVASRRATGQRFRSCWISMRQTVGGAQKVVTLQRTS